MHRTLPNVHFPIAATITLICQLTCHFAIFSFSIYLTHPGDRKKDDDLFRKMLVHRPWLTPQHLDLDADCHIDRVIVMLSDGLDAVRYPRGKLKVIKEACHALQAPNADALLPRLIYAVIKAAPSHLHSHLQFILRFTTTTNDIVDDENNSEGEYYLTSMMAAVKFIEEMDGRTFASHVDALDYERYNKQTIKSA